MKVILDIIVCVVFLYGLLSMIADYCKYRNYRNFMKRIADARKNCCGSEDRCCAVSSTCKVTKTRVPKM